MFDYIKFDEGSLRILLCVSILCLVWLFLWKKKVTSIVFHVVMGYLVIGFLSALVFYSLSQYQWYSFDQSEIQLGPLLYLTFLFLVMALPFLFLNPGKFDFFYDKGICRCLNGIAVLLAALSVLPFINGLIGLTSLTYDSIVNSYEGNNKLDNVNPLVYYSGQFRNYLKFFISPLLFYYLVKGVKFKRYFYCVAFAMMTTVLLSLVGGGRGTMVNEVNYIVICYLMFSGLLSKRMKQKTKRMGFVLLTSVVLCLTVITFARSNYSTSKASKQQKLDLITWVALYLGQGPLEFSRQMYPSTVRTEGDNSFSLVKATIGLKTFKDNNERREYWENKQTIQNFIFYTVIGDIYSDLGYTNTVIFILLVSLFMCCYFYNNRKLKIQTVVVSSVYFEWITMGFMTNCYKTYYSQFFILVTIVILMIMRIIQISDVGGAISVLLLYREYLRRVEQRKTYCLCCSH